MPVLKLIQRAYRMGFINGRKDLSKKKTVNIRYNLGFERMVKSCGKTV